MNKKEKRYELFLFIGKNNTKGSWLVQIDNHNNTHRTVGGNRRVRFSNQYWDDINRHNIKESLLPLIKDYEFDFNKPIISIEHLYPILLVHNLVLYLPIEEINFNE